MLSCFSKFTSDMKSAPLTRLYLEFEWLARLSELNGCWAVGELSMTFFWASLRSTLAWSCLWRESVALANSSRVRVVSSQFLQPTHLHIVEHWIFAFFFIFVFSQLIFVGLNSIKDKDEDKSDLVYLLGNIHSSVSDNWTSCNCSLLRADSAVRRVHRLPIALCHQRLGFLPHYCSPIDSI